MQCVHKPTFLNNGVVSCTYIKVGLQMLLGQKVRSRNFDLKGARPCRAMPSGGYSQYASKGPRPASFCTVGQNRFPHSNSECTDDLEHTFHSQRLHCKSVQIKVDVQQEAVG